MVKKVISGGQTGVDQLGLKVAKELGIATGGTAPLGYKTELGPYPSLKEDYGLKESSSSEYGPRTKDNVLEGEATVLFGETESSGSSLTIKLCGDYGKPFRLNPTIDELADFLIEHDVQILNVAGNRGSKVTTRNLLVFRDVLYLALKRVNNIK